MPTLPRRKLLQCSAAAFPVVSGCVSSTESTETASVELEIAVENETDDYYQADLVVLDEHGSKILGRDGAGWDAGSAITYRTELSRNRASELEVKVFLPQQSTTRLFERAVEPAYASDTGFVDVTVTPGPEVDIRV